MKVVKSVLKTVSMITFFTIITRVLGFVFRVFLSRKLGAEGIGIYQIATSIVGIFMTLVASGLPLTTAKMVAKYGHDNDITKQHTITTSSCVIALIISFVSIMLLIAGQKGMSVLIKSQLVVDIVLIMCPALIFSAVYAIFRGALWGQNSFFWVSFTEFLEQVIRIVLTFLVLNRMTNLVSSTKAVAYTFTLTCLFSSIFVIAIYLFSGGRIKFKKQGYKELVKRSAPITGVRLASSFIQPITALLIPFLLSLVGFSSSEAISTYGIIMGMTFPILFAPLSVVGSLSMVLIPKISVLEANKDYTTIASNIKKSVEFSLFLGVIFVPLFLACGDMIGIVLYNSIKAGIYLQLSAMCIIPLILNNITNSILNALNLEVKSFVNYLYGMIVLLISLVGFTFIIKENAIIVSYFLSIATTAILNIKMLNKKVENLHLEVVAKIFKYALIILPSSIIGHLIANILYHYIPVFFAGFVGGIVAIIFTVILTATFNLYEIKTILYKFRRKNS